MPGSLERINRDIAALEQEVLRLGAEFQTTYTGYLQVLAGAVKQQLILACYHLCTQGYPRQFLQLSYNQRQQLQDLLKALARQIEAELVAQLPAAVGESGQPEEAAIAAENSDAPPLPVPVETPPEKPGLVPFTETSPEALAQWCERLENGIAEQLRMASNAANRLLQQAEVLPKRLPEAVLEAALKADPPEAIVGPPNVLNLLIETVGEKPGDQEPQSEEELRRLAVMQVLALHLRLSEIEFADSMVMGWRNKLRSLTGRLKSLGQEFQKKQREKAVAEAEAAWRASWTNE